MTPNNTKPEEYKAFDNHGRYILPDYQQKKAFASFLPGLAGLQGIPMWVFYVNRGQAICSFGIQNKDHPILEFQSANKAYQSTEQLGYRTFLKGKRKESDWHCEVFSPWQSGSVQRNMFIGMNELEIQEINTKLGYQVNVLYFTLPGRPVPGLVRRVSIKNLDQPTLFMEVLDGLPAIIPYGIDNGALKHIGRTIEAWMQVENLENNLPFYRLKASPGDTTEIQAINSVNYAVAFLDGNTLPAFADPAVIFQRDTSLSKPHRFNKEGLGGLLTHVQSLEGQTPCAFFGTRLTIEQGQTQTFTSIYGHARSRELIEREVPSLCSQQFVDQKHIEARQLTIDLTMPIETKSSSPIFDAYCRQTFLDNLLRGGFPLILGDRTVYHAYSRKHGDIERDYNFFELSPAYYSQGNGNYRDVNQNRRNDVFFLPKAGLANIRLFMSLIQADGYNPLVVKGLRFSLTEDQVNHVLSKHKPDQNIVSLLRSQFTPGELLETLCLLEGKPPAEELMFEVFSLAQTHLEADHGEGFWIDHWTYNLDLIESYLAIFPEEKTQLLFESEPLPFFDNPFHVQPRAKRYVLSSNKPCQSNAVVFDEQKAALIKSRIEDPHWARTACGSGDIFSLHLFSKLVLLAFIKYATLDPGGMGIQMEAGRPGWYDALNGLPGLFGASMPETCELLRLVQFLIDVLAQETRTVLLPVEGIELVKVMVAVLDSEMNDFQAWDKRSTALESYRDSIKMGFTGEVDAIDVFPGLKKLSKALDRGIKKAEGLGELLPTYFIYSVKSYAETGSYDQDGRSLIHVKDFQVKPLPVFLEGFVRRMRLLDVEKVHKLHKRVKQSSLFDSKLNMLRVNDCLTDQSHEIGRARAFTPGWLENQSIWMHMAFKYLLELQRAGLHDDFFEQLVRHLPAFMSPDIYGRSPLENVSFVVSSVHPNPELHGNGFVARLSGSTAEFLTMWFYMTVGRQPFQVEKGELKLEIKPALPGWLFTKEGIFTFQFLGSCQVTLHNPSRKDTYHKDVKCSKTVLHNEFGDITFDGGVIKTPYAERIRNGEYKAIDIYFE